MISQRMITLGLGVTALFAPALAMKKGNRFDTTEGTQQGAASPLMPKQPIPVEYYAGYEKDYQGPGEPKFDRLSFGSPHELPPAQGQPRMATGEPVRKYIKTLLGQLVQLDNHETEAAYKILANDESKQQTQVHRVLGRVLADLRLNNKKELDVEDMQRLLQTMDMMIIADSESEIGEVDFCNALTSVNSIKKKNRWFHKLAGGAGGAGVGLGLGAGGLLAVGITQALETVDPDAVNPINHFQNESLFEMNAAFIIGVFMAGSALVLLTFALSKVAFAGNGIGMILATFCMLASCGCGIASMAIGENAMDAFQNFEFFETGNLVVDPASIMMFTSAIVGGLVLLCILYGLVSRVKGFRWMRRC